MHPAAVSQSQQPAGIPAADVFQGGPAQSQAVQSIQVAFQARHAGKIGAESHDFVVPSKLMALIAKGLRLKMRNLG